tara:strand:- start:378 stop:578 length:201 start_codon:yes stop_codon:yes gene_type:complete
MAAVELITTDVLAGADLVFGEVRQQLDTHKVAILATITKATAHQAVAEQVATIAAIEAQMDDQVTV